MKFIKLLVVLAALQVVSAGLSDLLKMGLQHTLKHTKKALDSYTTSKSLDEHGMDLLKMTILMRGEEAFCEDLRQSEFAALAPDLSFDAEHVSSRQGDVLPLVFLHGMGDSCYNLGMKNIANESGKYMGVYSVCVPTGAGRVKDTLNGFLMNMDDNVDALAAAVRADPNIPTAFNCVGLSQGNNLCRGYIQKYNGVAGYPLATAHISVHGPVVGVASLPSCGIDDGSSHGPLCKSVSELLGRVAYRPGIQKHLFQANYFRQVKDVASSDYETNSQMARWNNEGENVDSSINDRFGMTQRFAMIKANADTVVVPREGEWFGAYDEHYRLLSMNETKWYKNDLFGLKTADLAGKILFNSTEGNHLEFSTEQLFGWLDLYAL